MAMLSGFRALSQPSLALSTADHVPISLIDTSAPMRMEFEAPLGTSSSTESLHSSAYKVSITMDCTRRQLDVVLVQLAGIGSNLTIKIDTKS
jgi:hypothetical protein